MAGGGSGSTNSWTLTRAASDVMAVLHVHVDLLAARVDVEPSPTTQTR